MNADDFVYLTWRDLEPLALSRQWRPSTRRSPTVTGLGSTRRGIAQPPTDTSESPHLGPMSGCILDEGPASI